MRRLRDIGEVPLTLAALALALVAALVLGRATRPESRPVARYDVRMPVKTTLSVAIRPVLALSPDGATLVFVASAEGVPAFASGDVTRARRGP